MIIRRLKPSDASPYRRLRLKALRESASAFGSSYSEQAAKPLSFFAKKLEQTRYSWIFGAFENQKLIGVLRLTREESKKERHKASIYGLYVTPPQRRRGVARDLMKRALRQAQTCRGLRQLRIGVVASNRAAVQLYHAQGFSKYGEEKDALFVAGKFHSELLMAKRLS